MSFRIGGAPKAAHPSLKGIACIMDGLFHPIGLRKTTALTSRSHSLLYKMQAAFCKKPADENSSKNNDKMQRKVVFNFHLNITQKMQPFF